MAQERWSYEEAMRYLNSRTNYEKKTPTYGPVTFNLDRMRRLVSLLGNPQDHYPTVHITGTKGKGSVAAMVESCARSAGLTTGLYTSPHLVDLSERIALQGTPINRDDLATMLQRVSVAVEHLRGVALPPHPTFFEILTATAFCYFSEKRASLGVIEVGLGGRLDSTNVVKPAVTVLSRIGLDHTQQLGDTIAAIAGEKCGIIKPGIPVISAAQEREAAEVIVSVSRERGCGLFVEGKEVHVIDPVWNPHRFCWTLSVSTPLGQHRGLELPLLGRHQLSNCSLAVAALDVLSRSGILPPGDEWMREGLKGVRILARLQYVPGRPPMLLDGAHNPVSMQALVDTLGTFLKYRKLHLVYAMATDKDVAQCLRILLPRADYFYPTMSNSPRAMPTDELAALASQIKSIPVRGNPDSKAALAVALASADPDDLVLITGSLYLVGDLLGTVQQKR